MDRYRVVTPEHRGDFDYGIVDWPAGVWMAYTNSETDAERIVSSLNRERIRHHLVVRGRRNAEVPA
jgi:septum formation inhibitor-activating ATPase MinD